MTLRRHIISFICALALVVGASAPAAAQAHAAHPATVSWSCSVSPKVITYDPTVTQYYDATVAGPDLAFFDIGVLYPGSPEIRDQGVQELYPANTAVEHEPLLGTGNPVTIKIYAFGNHRYSHLLTSCTFESDPLT